MKFNSLILIVCTCTLTLCSILSARSQIQVQRDGNSIFIDSEEIYIQEEDDNPDINTGITNVNQTCQMLHSIRQRNQTILNNFCIPQQPINQGVMGVNLNIQETTVSLDAVDLKQPYILRVSIANANPRLIAGEIKLNNRVIKSLSNNQIEINLSPLLSIGMHKVEISGKYNPANSQVKVELLGGQTQVTQETSGSGTINQILIINVR